MDKSTEASSVPSSEVCSTVNSGWTTCGQLRWMRATLIAAAFYNLVWGAWVVFRPNDLFDLTEMVRPTYTGIWQCVGMIVGVYGIGYAVAAREPLRYWPITLVGLLGKVFGPIGFLFNLLTGDPASPGYLPISWGATIITNDLVWWIPFAAILYQAFKASLAPKMKPSVGSGAPAESGDQVSAVNERFTNQHGTSIAALSRQSPVVLLFLRHSGCTFCREALADLAAQRPKLAERGVRPVVVHLGDDRAAAAMLQGYGLDDVDRIADPTCQLYQAYELKRGAVGQLFGPSVWWRGFLAAIVARHGVGKLDGDGFQMPGAFLVHNNRVLHAYRHRTVADRPDLCELAGE